MELFIIKNTTRDVHWVGWFFAHILFSSQNLEKCKNSHLLTLVLDRFAIYFRIKILQALINRITKNKTVPFTII